MAEVIAGETAQHQKGSDMNRLFERIEQRNGQIERYRLHPWARGLL